MLRTVFKPQMDKTFCHVQIRQNPGTLHSLNHATPKWYLKISKECTRLRHPSLTSPKWVGQLKDSSTAAIYHQTQEKETYFGGSHDFAHSSQHLLLQLHMIHLLGTTTSNTIKGIQVHALYLTPPPTLLQKPMDLPSPTHHTLIHPPILPQPPPIRSLQAIHLGINYVDSPTVKSRRIHPIQSSPPSLSTLLLLDINRRISSSLHPSLLTPSPTLPHQPHSSLLYKLLTP